MPSKIFASLNERPRRPRRTAFGSRLWDAAVGAVMAAVFILFFIA